MGANAQKGFRPEDGIAPAKYHSVIMAWLPAQRMVPKPAASASPRSWLEIQNLSPCSPPLMNQRPHSNRILQDPCAHSDTGRAAMWHLNLRNATSSQSTWKNCPAASLFYWGGNRGSERCSHLPKLTQSQNQTPGAPPLRISQSHTQPLTEEIWVLWQVLAGQS